MKLNFTLVSLLIKSCITAGILAILANPSYASPTAAPDDNASAGEYSPESREYHLKAAFLRYVAKYVQWPADTLSPGTINICLLGLVPSFEALNSINQKVVDDRTLVLTKVTDVGAAKNHCQILFVTKTASNDVKNIISTLQGLPVLTYGDMDNFAEQGGCMNFYIMNNRLAIMINPPAVEKAKLKIDPHMLKLVTIIPPIDQTAPHH